MCACLKSWFFVIKGEVLPTAVGDLSCVAACCSVILVVVAVCQLWNKQNNCYYYHYHYH